MLDALDSCRLTCRSTASPGDSAEEAPLGTARPASELGVAEGFCLLLPQADEPVNAGRISPCRLDADGAPVVELAGAWQKLFQFGVWISEKARGLWHFRFNFGRGLRFDLVVVAESKARAVNMVESKAAFISEVKTYLKQAAYSAASDKSEQRLVRFFKDAGGSATLDGHQVGVFFNTERGSVSYRLLPSGRDAAIKMVVDRDAPAANFPRRGVPGAFSGADYTIVLAADKSIALVGKQGTSVTSAVRRGLMPN
jgi:hypothetical protein